MKKDSIKVEDIIKKCKKSQKRIKQLAALGINIEKYFSIIDDRNHDLLMVNENGKDIKVSDFGLVEIMESVVKIQNEIAESGNVEVSELYRRWVMAQLFGIADDGYDGIDSRKFDRVIRRRGLKYVVKMATEEARVLAKLETRDQANFNERKKFFTTGIFSRLAEHVFIDASSKLDGAIEGSTRYISGLGRITPSQARTLKMSLLDAACAVSAATSYAQIYENFKKFDDKRTMFKGSNNVPDFFIKAFKDCGAYYAAKNMILFHNCRFTGMDRAVSMRMLNDESNSETRNMFGVLRHLIEDSDFSFRCRMTEIYSRR